MRDSAYEDTPAYYGWRWANALSFLEQAYYGTDYGGNVPAAQDPMAADRNSVRSFGGL